MRRFRDIIENNELASITVVKMEVPCCTGLARAVEAAVNTATNKEPLEIITLSRKGQVI